jgi:hypothetical protein
LGVASAACADRAPEPKWPEPPPPTVAEPIGQSEQVAREPAPPLQPPAPEPGTDQTAPVANEPEDGAVRIDG